jgi:hypothetical protein
MYNYSVELYPLSKQLSVKTTIPHKLVLLPSPGNLVKLLSALVHVEQTSKTSSF